ncbi:22390_t:CDS:2, partial [Gigaspora margarita]
KVIGIDIFPIQSTQIKPKNFEFSKANAQEGLPFDDNTFDFLCKPSKVIDGRPVTQRLWNRGMYYAT